MVTSRPYDDMQYQHQKTLSNPTTIRLHEEEEKTRNHIRRGSVHYSVRRRGRP